MTENEALNMMQAKLTCMELYDLSCVEKGCDKKCENCEYNYAQGNNGEQKEALKVAIQALEKQIQKKPKKIKAEGYRYTDTYRCPLCGGNFSGTGIADYCYHCGQKLDCSDEE